MSETKKFDINKFRIPQEKIDEMEELQRKFKYYKTLKLDSPQSSFDFSTINFIREDGSTYDENDSRVKMCVGFVCSLLCNYNYNIAFVFSKISHITDHKGELAVTWKEIPYTECNLTLASILNTFNHAWKSVIGDGCCATVYHTVQTISYSSEEAYESDDFDVDLKLIEVNIKLEQY